MFLTCQPAKKSYIFLSKFHDVFTPLTLAYDFWISEWCWGWLSGRKGRGTRSHLQLFVPLFAIASSRLSTPAEVRRWSGSLADFFPFRLNPRQPTEGVSRPCYSAPTAVHNTGLLSPHGCQRSRSQVTASLGTQVAIFFIVWKRRAWVIYADGSTQATKSTAAPGQYLEPHGISPLSLCLPWQHCAGCQSHRRQRPAGFQHPGTDVGNCEQWPCCRRQGTAGGLMICPCWSPRSTPEYSCQGHPPGRQAVLSLHMYRIE